jgi:hypothetical protein
VQARLRDEAKKRARNAWIVTDATADAEFFKGAAVATTGTEKVARGWRLTALADLVPIPPPAPPTLWDDAGRPLAPSASLARKARERGAGTLEGDEVPTYPLETIIEEWPECVAPRSRSKVRFDLLTELSEGTLSESPIDAEGDSVPDTFVYWDRHQVFAVGPARPELAELFAGWHPVAKADWAEPFLKALRQESHRLWKHEHGGDVPTEAGRALLTSLVAPTQLDLAGTLVQCAKKRRSPEEEECDADAFPDPAGEARCRESLLAILHRPLHFAWSDADVLLVIRHIGRADLVPLPVASPQTLHVLADLGAGRWARVIVEKRQEKQAMALRVLARNAQAGIVLDGGDLHVRILLGGDADWR